MLKRLTSLILILALLACALPAAAASGTLREGSRGSEVTKLQNALKNLGFYTMAVDGKYGKGTAAAVRSFQRKNGLKADGIAGPATLGRLYGSTSSGDTQGTGDASTGSGSSETGSDQAVTGTLRPGSSGEAVKKLQRALKAQGFYTLAVDGKYGRGTAAAVRDFQRKNGLKPDGIAGPITLAKVFGSSSGTSPETSPETGDGSTSGSSAATLRPGSSGDAVKDLQTKLWYTGYYTGNVSGSFDTDTQEAVIAFQKAQSLSRDGIAGKKTLAALERVWTAAKEAAGSVPDEAAAMLNRIAAETGAVCGTLVLSKDGETFLTWSFGGVDENTCFRIASITKWVTAIGLMTLYDQGKLDLDRDISEYLPFTVRNPAWPDRAITARMLLSHTSSLSPDASVYRPNWENIGKNGYDPIFDEHTEPGTKYAYADYNGALFGGLIEAITGESVQNYMSRTVFEPLGLTAGYSPNFLPAGTAAKDTLYANGRVGISVQNDRNASYNNTADPRRNNGYTVGRLYINTASLTKLAQMMLSGGELNGVRILERATVSLMEDDQPGLAASKYGLSNVRHSQFPRGTWYGHQGRYIGLTSNVYYQVETGITIALVMNGYDYQLQDNIVMPAVTIMNNMEKLESLCVR